MAFLRTLLSRRSLSPSSILLHPHTPHSFNFPPFRYRPFTSSPQIQHPLDSEPDTKQNKRPLHALFMEAVGLSEQTGTISDSEESEGETESKEMKRKLRQLEGEVRSVKEKTKGVPKNNEKSKKSERKSLYAAFINQSDSVVSKRKEVKLREPMVFKDLSPDMEIFVHHLYRNGYFKDANFAKDKTFNLSWFESFFARGYIKFAAQKFARDNQEIAKWLSGSALKQVALFGCPSADRGSVFPAKRLRKFFEIPENTVCSKCMLRQSCKFENQSVWKSDTNNLDLDAVMKVITSYALELVHPQLVVPDQVNKSVSQLLREVVKLNQTT